MNEWPAVGSRHGSQLWWGLIGSAAESPREQCSDWREERGSGSFDVIDSPELEGMRRSAGEGWSQQLTVGSR